MSELYEVCTRRDLTKVALVGAGELGEIGLLCARQHPVIVVGFVDPDKADSTLHDLKIVSEPGQLDGAEVFLVTDVSNPQSTYEWLAQEVPRNRILCPGLLNITENPPETSE